MSDLAIKIEGLKKQYRLGSIGGGTLTSDLQSWWARKRGKDDPNVKVDVDQTRIGDTFYALDGIDLSIRKGETVGIIGANGAGKSTLLKIIARVTAPTEGTVGINGRITSMLEVGTGFHPELTGRENIYMNGAILGMTKKEIESKIEDIIEFSECRTFIDTPVKRYSSGMYVKLAYSVAAHLDSEIMIMDEVLAVGDVKFQSKCIDHMNINSQNKGKTILYVSHNMATVRKLCDRCIVLDSGKLIYDGDVETAIQKYMKTPDAGRRTHYCLDNAYRPVWESGFPDLGKPLRIMELEFPDEPRFYTNDRIEFDLVIDCFEDIDNICLYLRLLGPDDMPVALIESDEIFTCTKGVRKRITLSASLGNLAPGTYYFFMAAFVRSKYTASVQLLDKVRERIEIEIVDKERNNRLEFKRIWYGDVRITDFKLIKEQSRIR